MCTNPTYLKDKNMFVDCKNCIECKIKRAKEWACRLYFELQKTPQACFITLTYKENPVLLDKTDIQKFIKRLREKIAPQKIKYFLVGEYGDRHWRPHYHAIILGYDFPDKYVCGKSPKKHDMYISPALSRLWPQGFHTIQDTSLATCVYTSLYAGTPRWKLPKALQDAPEFNLMSQSLGVDAIIANYDQIQKTDEIFIDGKSFTVPQAVLNRLYIIRNPDGTIKEKAPEYEALKENRLQSHKQKNKKYYQLSEELVKTEQDISTAVDKIKAINAYYTAQKAFRAPIDDKIYRQEKKILTKNL